MPLAGVLSNASSQGSVGGLLQPSASPAKTCDQSFLLIYLTHCGVVLPRGGGL